MQAKESDLWHPHRHMDREREKSLRQLCIACRHYFVTWDPSAPYGCRAMGFKGPQIPSVTVFQSSGMECQLFDPKKKNKREGPAQK